MTDNQNNKTTDGKKHSGRPYRSECTCPCHKFPGTMHIVACCQPDPVSKPEETP